jgi:hypothetical protein
MAREELRQSRLSRQHEVLATLNSVVDPSQDEFESETGPADTWAGYVAGPELVPSYLVSRFAAQYRVIVEVLLAAQDDSLTGLSYGDVASGVRSLLRAQLAEETADGLLAADAFRLDDRLARLEKWQVVTRWQEPARTGEDFLRRRDRYQLTPLAARLHTFWTRLDGGDEQEAGDLTLAPRAMYDRLAAFRDAIQDCQYPVAASEYQQVAMLHHGMARAAQSWQRTLAHALSGGPDPVKQELLWQTLRSYVGMWGEQVDVYSPRISELIVELYPALTVACGGRAPALRWLTMPPRNSSDCRRTGGPVLGGRCGPGSPERTDRLGVCAASCATWLRRGRGT